jgi:uncharacterized protein (UPF0264 family)
MDAVLSGAGRRDMSVTPRLLVSVRDAAEAEAALAGGADLIDVKEPSRGALGRADASVIADVVRVVGGRAPVSAALGELRECPLVGTAIDLPEGIAYVKWGLTGLLRREWAHYFGLARLVIWSGPQLVAVGYADWVPADAPRPADVVAQVCESRQESVLLDTFQKDGSTLLDWLAVDDVANLVETCHAEGVKIALAGSLGPAEIEPLLPLAPDWFAVRGAACEGGRGGRVTADRVRALADLLKRG